MNRQKCPCCGFPTIVDLGIYDICELCNWEDDGQNEETLGDITGGPNGDYSLLEARKNFEDHLTMYRKGDILYPDTPKEIELKQKLMQAFIELYEYDQETSVYAALWKEIQEMEKELRVESHRKFQ